MNEDLDIRLLAFYTSGFIRVNQRLLESDNIQVALPFALVFEDVLGYKPNTQSEKFLDVLVRSQSNPSFAFQQLQLLLQTPSESFKKYKVIHKRISEANSCRSGYELMLDHLFVLFSEADVR